MMQWLIDLVYDKVVAALGHVWDIADIVPDEDQLIIGDGSIWKGELISSMIARYPRFVTRGDPPSYDFTQAHFTVDGNWHTLNLSAIVPAGASLVALSYFLLDDQIGSFLQFKTLGNTNPFNSGISRTQVTNLVIDANIVVAPDADRKVAYRTSATVFTTIRLAVRGWWL